MSESAFPSPDADVESVTPDELYERIDAGDAVTLLDVRATNEYEKWHIDGETVESINVPYFEYLADDPDHELFDPVPEDEEVTVLCAKGGSSEYIAGLFAERNYDVNHLEDGMNGWAHVLERTEIEDSTTDATVVQSTNGRPAGVCPISSFRATSPPSSTRFGRSRTSMRRTPTDTTPTFATPSTPTSTPTTSAAYVPWRTRATPKSSFPRPPRPAVSTTTSRV